MSVFECNKCKTRAEKAEKSWKGVGFSDEQTANVIAALQAICQGPNHIADASKKPEPEPVPEGMDPTHTPTGKAEDIQRDIAESELSKEDMDNLAASLEPTEMEWLEERLIQGVRKYIKHRGNPETRWHVWRDVHGIILKMTELAEKGEGR